MESNHSKISDLSIKSNSQSSFIFYLKVKENSKNLKNVQGMRKVGSKDEVAIIWKFARENKKIKFAKMEIVCWKLKSSCAKLCENEESSAENFYN